MRITRLSDHDVYLFREGTHARLYERLGAHLTTLAGEAGTAFAVWAPHARAVSVMGSFNGWDPGRHPLVRNREAGVWEGFVPHVGPGTLYKYHIVSRRGHHTIDKADPVGFFHQVPPLTASVVWDSAYTWGDAAWMQSRARHNAAEAPHAVYEVHLGSWQRRAEEAGRSLSYRELADVLPAYVGRMGFTHVELLPVMEHPFYGSWGYQTTGYFAPTSRYGTPQDLMHLIDAFHQQGIAVILDWVPSHFPTDGHGLGYFDGTHLYEHGDPREGFHQDWKSFIFNYGRGEVRSFLLSSACFWLDRFHADGLRVDAVASMLYRDYSRKEGEWTPNIHGGREHLEAISFLRVLNDTVHTSFPGALCIAEESTAWPMVSRPTSVGGLGFAMKWDMGWMHDTLKYFSHDPIHRAYHHRQITFRGLYAFSERFVLALSHDEVVHGKRSLLERMPGDEWQRFANLRALYGYMYMQPGKKLLFMGGEFGQTREWNHDGVLDWPLLEHEPHAGLQRWVTDLNRFYAGTPAAHALDFEPAGFEWIDADDSRNSVLTWLRRGPATAPQLLVACNFTPVPRTGYRVGVPCGGLWHERLNSDAENYGGSGWGNYGRVEAEALPWHGRPWSLDLVLPPLSVTVFESPPPEPDPAAVAPAVARKRTPRRTREAAASHRRKSPPEEPGPA